MAAKSQLGNALLVNERQLLLYFSRSRVFSQGQRVVNSKQNQRTRKRALEAGCLPFTHTARQLSQPLPPPPLGFRKKQKEKKLADCHCIRHSREL